MNTAAFIQAYNASRNGAAYFVRHALVRQFNYSDGVEECANAGCHWLLDILATECPVEMRHHRAALAQLDVTVRQDKGCTLTLYTAGAPIWTRGIPFTDLPVGQWVFYLADEGTRFTCVLPSEN